MEHGAVSCTTALESVALYNTLETTTFAGSLYVNYVTNLEQFLNADFLTNLVGSVRRNPELTNVIETFRVGLFHMTCDRLVHPLRFFLVETNLNCAVAVILYSFHLEDLARACFYNCDRYCLTQFSIDAGHSNFFT